jgi:hypothetical protein
VGLYKTGKKFSVRGASVYELRGGKFSGNRDYYDSASIMRQVGVLPGGAVTGLAPQTSAAKSWRADSTYCGPPCSPSSHNDPITGRAETVNC